MNFRCVRFALATIFAFAVAGIAAPGLRLVGRLPASLQTFTTYTAALPATGRHAEAARQLLDHLASPAAQAMFARAGIDPAP